MTPKSSAFIKETREREAWLPSTAEKEGGNAKDAEQLMAVAALTRGVFESIPVPEEAEEQSRQKAVEHMKALYLERLQSQHAPRAPWYLRLGRFMQYVFTLGRRR